MGMGRDITVQGANQAFCGSVFRKKDRGFVLFCQQWAAGSFYA
jgi:hypothetical protein